MRDLRHDLDLLAARKTTDRDPTVVVAEARRRNRRRVKRQRLVASSVAAVVVALSVVAVQQRGSPDRVESSIVATEDPTPTTTQLEEEPRTTADYLRTGKGPALFRFDMLSDRPQVTDGSGNLLDIDGATGCGWCVKIVFGQVAFSTGLSDSAGKLTRIDLKTLSAVVLAADAHDLLPGSDGHSIWVVGPGRDRLRHMDISQSTPGDVITLPANRVARAAAGRYLVLGLPNGAGDFELWDPVTGELRKVGDDVGLVDATTNGEGEALVAWWSRSCTGVTGCQLNITNVDRGSTASVSFPEARLGVFRGKFSSGGKHLAVLAPTIAVAPDGHLFMIDVDTLAMQTIQHVERPINGIAFLEWSADGNWLLFGGRVTLLHRLGTPDAVRMPFEDGSAYRTVFATVG